MLHGLLTCSVLRILKEIRTLGSAEGTRTGGIILRPQRRVGVNDVARSLIFWDSEEAPLAVSYSDQLTMYYPGSR